MSRGNADYQNPNYTFSVSNVDAIDEFAIRYGFSRVDNRGRVLFVEDFQAGLIGWNLASDGLGVDPVHLYRKPYNWLGNGSIELDPVGLDGYSQMYRNSVISGGSRIGLEVGLYLPASNANWIIKLNSTYTDGRNYELDLFGTQNTSIIYVSSSGGDVAIVSGATSADLQQRWIPIKIVMDMSINKAVRAMVGSIEYDISPYDLGSVVQGVQGDTKIDIAALWTNTAFNEPIYIGYIVLTGDEP